MSSDRLLDPVSQLRGVGPKLEILLIRAGIRQIRDLLFRLPIRYLDKTRITSIGALRPNTYVVIEGEIQAADVLFGRRRSLMVKLGDLTGIATLRFFHFSMGQKQLLARGKRLRCSGEVRLGRSGLEMYHPEYQFVEEGAAPPEPELTPVYSTTDGLSQHRLRDLAGQALKLMAQSEVEDLLHIEQPPDNREIETEVVSASLKTALSYLHRPPQNAPVELLLAGIHPHQKRLAFEELVAHQLSLQKARRRIRAAQAFALSGGDELRRKLLAALGFDPTAAQHRVTAEIDSDLAKPQPMLRLLQGDVGSGKTLVAALSMLRALGSGAQAALMAPTEILAEQHRNTFENWFNQFDIKLVMLTGKTKGKARQAVLDMLVEGHAQLAIGTHALFQEDVRFNKLALVVIDEQHRFGVKQRLAMSEKGAIDDSGIQARPHQLIMTATPIPRTLAMSHYSDLDCSIIDELPPGRTPVKTLALPASRRDQLMGRVREACHQGRQVYWVCTLIEESETLQAQAAEATASELQLALAEISIGLIHGRMKPAEKSAVMEAFKSGELQLLVATTVIEVGVDVPNASLMVIENPERLGLAQLHQLRGRVGRGSQESHCILLYESPLSDASTRRIDAMRQTTDGFKIADIDLELRGPGELLGARQAGEISFLLADLERDQDLLPRARDTARAMLNNYPQNAEKLLDRWVPNVLRYLDA